MCKIKNFLKNDEIFLKFALGIQPTLDFQDGPDFQE